MTMNTQLAPSPRVSLIDSVTGLPNRTAFERLLSETTQQNNKSAPPFAILLIEVHGEVGDQVLRLVGRAFEASLRRSDRLARYDGNRFIAMLPSTGRQAAAAAGDQVVEQIACGEMRGRITLSFGATEYRRGDSVRALLARAEHALRGVAATCSPRTDHGVRRGLSRAAGLLRDFLS